MAWYYYYLPAKSFVSVLNKSLIQVVSQAWWKERVTQWDGNRKLWPLGPCCLVRRADRVPSVNNNNNSLLSCYKMTLFSWRERRAGE